ncbi:PQQ-dependent sugar dehydrogenase [Parapedobacter sp. DT-150]|uniref:PQQ-dependent sugar dehydrogenase n=1 Tax=Parapedobacter sp. DT-150 TaxID=3396162 RepID=UPI003F19E692
MNRKMVLVAAFIGLSFLMLYAFKNGTSREGEQHMDLPEPDDGNAGLKLPDGFGALIAADNLGKARHIVVTQDGSLYVKLARPVDEKGILYLKDSNADGRMDEQLGFGNYGGTGIYLKEKTLYASSNEEVFSYQLNEKNEVVNPEKPATLVTGLVRGRQHDTKSIVLDNDGNIYVNIGAPSNSCQEKDRTPGSMGREGCPLLDSAGGIWQFRTDKLNQSYAEGIRYATGLRNVVGLDWNQETNTLFVMQHGRDQLHGLFPDLYDEKTSSIVPAECMYRIGQGDNAGWPFAYYDQLQGKNIQAPEYGGDGKKEASKEFIDPVLAFPGHLAPNGLLFYTGNQFPERYRNGAFVAFHGSWNRTPFNQEGFYVVFAPFKDGKSTGEWEVFADGFAGTDAVVSPRDAKYRPCGLAQGPDGSLYVTDDVKGRIYRINYQ